MNVMNDAFDGPRISAAEWLNELRLLTDTIKFDLKYNNIFNKEILHTIDFTDMDDDNGIRVPVELTTLLKSIYVSPKASNSFRQKLKDTLIKNNISQEILVNSEMTP